MTDSGAGGPRSTWETIDRAAPQPHAVPLSLDGLPAGTPPAAHVEGRLRVRRSARPATGAFDAGGALLQRHARVAVLGSALVLVPVLVFNLVVAQAAFEHFDATDGVLVSVPELVGGAEAATGAETLFALVAVLANSLAVAVAGGFLAVLVIRSRAGRATSLGAVWAATWRRVPALTSAWVVGHSWFALGALVVVQLEVSDLASMLTFLVPLGLLAMALTTLVSPAIVAEGLGPWRGLRRGVQLARMRFSTVIGFVVVCAVVGGGLRVMIGLLPWLMESTGLITFGRFGAVLSDVAAQVGQLIVVPLVGLATAELYLQQRMDTEGMDLVLEAGDAFG